MTKLAVPIIVESTARAHAMAQMAARQGADIVEYRIDRFIEGEGADELSQLMTLIDDSPLPCIITCRPTWEGGYYDGDERSRIAILEHIKHAKRPPLYLDFELKAYQASANIRQKIHLVVDHADQPRPVETRLILSSHDFDSRPRDLLGRISAMSEYDQCAVIKIVWASRSLRDNLEAFEILDSKYKPTIALCMGQTGLASRILAKKFGALLTFAALDTDQTSAPGQPTLSDCKKRYRWDALNRQTRVYGVIGDPVAHSISPHMHNAGFDRIDFNGVYLPLPIPGAYEHFKATVGSWLDFKALDFSGASVTIPHKQNLIRFVQEAGGQVEPLAKRIGAANTLTVRDDGTLYASNTDYGAALDTVCHRLNLTREQLRGKRIAILGAGGVARAIVAGFSAYGASLTIFNRTHEKAVALAEKFNAHLSGDAPIQACPFDQLHQLPLDILINCTSVGMSPRVEQSPLPELAAGQSFSHWGKDTLIFDTIYNPKETRLLRFARTRGCQTVNGAKMLAMQAQAQFTLWTRQAPPEGLFEEIVERGI